MLPTYASDRLNLVNRLAYTMTTPARGDVIAIELAGPHVGYVNRIIGLPGARVAINGGEVEINGAPLPEPYVRHQREWSVPEVTLGSQEYFVMGDNRRLSDFGRVQVDKILGKVVF